MVLVESGATGQSDGNQATGSSGGQASQGASGSGAAGQASGSGAQPTWRDSLPPELKDNPTLALYSDITNLAKAHVHAQSVIGKKGVFVPGEKASEEDWKKFYKEIGQPDPDKFEIKGPDGVQLNPEFISKFKESAHQMGLLPKQAQGLMDWYLKHEKEVQTSLGQRAESDALEGLKGLQKEWGDGYGKQIARAEAAMQQIGGDPFKEYLVKKGLTKDVEMIKFLNKTAPLLGEDQLRGDGSGKFGSTPAEIQDQLDKIRNDSKSPYYDRNHADHDRVNKQVEALYRALASQKAS